MCPLCCASFGMHHNSNKGPTFKNGTRLCKNVMLGLTFSKNTTWKPTFFRNYCVGPTFRNHDILAHL